MMKEIQRRKFNDEKRLAGFTKACQQPHNKPASQLI